MRILVVLGSVMLLAGCSSFDFSREPVPPAPVASGQPDAACQHAATEHAADVLSQGFDVDVQQQVFEAAYRDCLDWKNRT